MYTHKTIMPSLVALVWSTCVLAYPPAPGYQLGFYLGGTETNLNPNPLQLVAENDELVPNSQPMTDFTWGFNAAYRFLPPENLMAGYLFRDITLGLDFLYFQVKQNGAVWQFEQPAYNNYSYTLNTNSARLLVDSEWTLSPNNTNWFPFVIGGIGFVYNTLAYSDVANISGSGGTLSIGEGNQYHFTYTIGAGLKYDLPFIKNTEVSLRYLYAGLDNAGTSSNPSIPLSAPLTVRLYTQAWVFGFTYLFS